MWEIQKFTISYNANGGTGAPSSQTKTYGTNITLSSTKPTRSGYTFQGWATSATGSVTYNPGSMYSSNANLNLYAIWKLGDSEGPIYCNGMSLCSVNEVDVYFCWENSETCSLDGIICTGSSINSIEHCVRDGYGYYIVTLKFSQFGDGFVQVTLADGSWCKVIVGLYNDNDGNTFFVAGDITTGK